PRHFFLLFNITSSIHLLNCVIAIIGAFKLRKWFLIPFIIFEFIRVLLLLTTHIVLIYLLPVFIGYNWSAVVALFQLITLVNSEKYKKLYGDDPMKPIVNSQNGLSTTPEVKMIYTPDYDTVLKKLNKEPKIIAVQPSVNEIAIANYKNWYHRELVGVI
uniref:Uncharacterized protein n=1 Tax=Megaselia scalaris TaxID=36166 RepID=T1H503_MEGSC